MLSRKWTFLTAAMIICIVGAAVAAPFVVNLINPDSELPGQREENKVKKID